MKRRNYKGRELLPLAMSDAAQAGDADAVEQVLVVHFFVGTHRILSSTPDEV